MYRNHNPGSLSQNADAFSIKVYEHVSWLMYKNRYVNVKKVISTLIALIIFLSVFSPAIADSSSDVYRDLSLGDKGADVLAVKMKLYELKYIKNKPTNKTYRNETVKVVKQFQEDYDLKPTGNLSIDQQNYLLSLEYEAPPATPDGLKGEIVEEKGTFYFNLTWNLIPACSMYSVYRSQDDGKTFSFAGTASRNIYQEDISWSKQEREYIYKVRSTGNQRKSGYSDGIKVKIPDLSDRINTSSTGEAKHNSVNLSKDEAVVIALSGFLGVPLQIKMEKDKNVVPNSRSIIINHKSYPDKILVMFVTGAYDMYSWVLDLIQENLIKAQLALDEDSACSVAVYNKEGVLYSASYSGNTNSTFVGAYGNYDDFLEKVKEILNSLSSDSISRSVSPEDLFLSSLYGLDFGASIEKVKAENNTIVFEEVHAENTNSSFQSLSCKLTIAGEEIRYLFMFKDNQLYEIRLFPSEELREIYILQCNNQYGDPVHTSYLTAYSGFEIEGSEKDTDVWTINGMKILVSSGGSGITYMPAY